MRGWGSVSVEGALIAASLNSLKVFRPMGERFLGRIKLVIDQFVNA